MWYGIFTVIRISEHGGRSRTVYRSLVSTVSLAFTDANEQLLKQLINKCNLGTVKQLFKRLNIGLTVVRMIPNRMCNNCILRHRVYNSIKSY